MTTYRVAELPDPTCANYQAAANGAVREAIWNDAEQWLRTLASLPPGAATAEIRFLYRPTRDPAAVQSRLRLFFIIRAREEGAGALLRSLIESGPLSRFYHFEATESPTFPAGRMRAACDVVRRAELVTPLYDVEHNRFIPSRYFTICPFEPNPENDYLTLDCVLGNITEPVAISICFEPVEISSVLDQHTRYLARLARINRPWDDDASEQLGETGWPLRVSRRSPHCEDPLADDILRRQRRFHETLPLPHLHFHIRVWAATMAVAHAIGSVVAGSAFRQSSYRTIGSTQGDASFPALSAGRHHTGVTALPICESLWNRKELKLYGGLTPLVNLAPVEELAAAIRLPVGSFSSPACIRKSTGPLDERVDDLIVLGID